jgi:hypothetical protein
LRLSTPTSMIAAPRMCPDLTKRALTCPPTLNGALTSTARTRPSAFPASSTLKSGRAGVCFEVPWRLA